ncbi:MAG: pyridoxal-phosphate dependent enzyme [Myxococcota bacterium]|nr:pyridoxal-phosphate dependent enzyme [Myxococcota bacterium]
MPTRTGRLVLPLNEKVRTQTALRCRQRGITLPTFAQLESPELFPSELAQKLPGVGLWDVHPLNLLRITWKNDVVTGGFGSVNAVVLPSSLTGVRAQIIGLVGQRFPTGAHKVGAAYGCLVPLLVSGQFDPERHKAVWPSTGNFCRGGAFDCALLGCTAVAILPEEMSAERFAWLHSIGAQVIATKGCESNVKEIYDKCWELRRDPENIILNQFEQLGNSLFHYRVTGPALREAYEGLEGPRTRLAAFVSSTGSGGTIAAGDYLKAHLPDVTIVAAEALECPTLLRNGFGAHRIEGIGDKHVPWIHNVRNTDAVAAIADEDAMRLARLFNTEAGHDHLIRNAVPLDIIEQLHLLGISSIANVLAAIKTARHFELDENDVVLTVLTDSMDLYQSRLQELETERGPYTALDAAADLASRLHGQRTDHYAELNYPQRKALHNLKYFTWVEQQGKTVKELNELWDKEFWRSLYQEEADELERRIEEFNCLVAGCGQ